MQFPTIITSITVLALTSIPVVISVWFHSPVDEEKKMNRLKATLEPIPLHKLVQQRESISKWIYVNNDTHSTVHITCERSVVVCYEKEQHMEIVEQMQGVECCIAETVSVTGVRKVQTMIADNANLHYNDKLLIGNHVKIKHYELQEDQNLQDLVMMQPTMEGTAECIELLFANHDLQVKAFSLKTTIANGGI